MLFWLSCFSFPVQSSMRWNSMISFKPFVNPKAHCRMNAGNCDVKSPYFADPLS